CVGVGLIDGLVARVRGAPALRCVARLGSPPGRWRAPMHPAPFPAAPPAIYSELMPDPGISPPVPIVEIPVMVGGDQTYMYYSMFHRQRLLNGYSGFFPASYLRLAGAMQGFPDEHSMRALRTRGARYALLHGEFLERAQYADMTRAADQCQCGLTLVGRRSWANREISLYRIEY